MPIQEGNIVFLESQVMDDVAEGGGAATGNVIQDGVLNNVFEDISDLDRAYGRFNLRKLFLGVRSLDTDLYGGAKLVVTQLPNDESLGYALFTTEDPFDTRDAAADRVEAYLYKGPLWHGQLFENHIAGTRQIRVIQRPGSALPVIGKTLCLVQFEGTASEIEQYIRVVDVESVETILSYFNGGTAVDYQRLIVTLTLSDALRHDFAGHTPSPVDAYTFTAKAMLRDTSVADATNYYGSQRIAQAAAIGDLRVKAESMFAQLVPSAQTETPLVSQLMAGAITVTVDAGNGHSVNIAQAAHSLFKLVTPENRRLNWIETVQPRPAPGTVSVSFMAQGNWYLLSDNGAGALVGTDAGFGAGTVDYVTGTVAVTLGALPDAGSQILYLWGSPVHYTQRITAEVSPPVWSYLLGSDTPEEEIFSIEPGTVEITWQAAGVTKTLADTDADHLLQGDGYGAIDYATGSLWFRPSVLPDPLSTPVVEYERATTHVETFTPALDGNGFATITLANTPVQPGSVSLTWETIREKTATEKTTGETNLVSYYTSDDAYSSETSLSDESSWARPSSSKRVE